MSRQSRNLALNQVDMFINRDALQGFGTGQQLGAVQFVLNPFRHHTPLVHHAAGIQATEYVTVIAAHASHLDVLDQIRFFTVAQSLVAGHSGLI